PATTRPCSRGPSTSSEALTENFTPHRGQITSLCRPIRVGAIEPAAISNASASTPRITKARIKATTICSIRSRFESLCGTAVSPVSLFDDFDFDLEATGWGMEDDPSAGVLGVRNGFHRRTRPSRDPGNLDLPARILMNVA